MSQKCERKCCCRTSTKGILTKLDDESVTCCTKSNNGQLEAKTLSTCSIKTSVYSNNRRGKEEDNNISAAYKAVVKTQNKRRRPAEYERTDNNESSSPRNVWRNIQYSSGNAGGRQRSRYLSASKWVQHSSSHCRHLTAAFISMCIISKESSMAFHRLRPGRGVTPAK